MKCFTKTAVLTAVLALSAVPAFALPSQVPKNQGTAHIPSDQGTQRAPDGPGRPESPGSQGAANRPATPGPHASAKSKRRAYGKVCAASHLSKKHVKGEKGTPFSRCVTAMAKLASEQTKSPRKACKAESKKHVKGKKGTPFSQCVSAAAKQLRQMKDDAADTAPETETAS